MSQLNERVILNDEPDRIKEETAIANFKASSLDFTGGTKRSHKSPQPFNQHTN